MRDIRRPHSDRQCPASPPAMINTTPSSSVVVRALKAIQDVRFKKKGRPKKLSNVAELSSDEAAFHANVSRSTIATAIKIKKGGMAEKVLSGELSPINALRLIDGKPTVTPKPMASRKQIAAFANTLKSSGIKITELGLMVGVNYATLCSYAQGYRPMRRERLQKCLTAIKVIQEADCARLEVIEKYRQLLGSN